MLSGYRVRMIDDMGDTAEDFVAGDIVHLPKRAGGFVVPTDPRDHRVIKMKAVGILSRNGMSAAEIAVAMGCDPKTVRNYRGRNRALREAVTP